MPDREAVPLSSPPHVEETDSPRCDCELRHPSPIGEGSWAEDEVQAGDEANTGFVRGPVRKGSTSSCRRKEVIMRKKHCRHTIDWESAGISRWESDPVWDPPVPAGFCEVGLTCPRCGDQGYAIVDPTLIVWNTCAELECCNANEERPGVSDAHKFTYGGGRHIKRSLTRRRGHRRSDQSETAGGGKPFFRAPRGKSGGPALRELRPRRRRRDDNPAK
jgi:hypothetical protein